MMIEKYRDGYFKKYSIYCWINWLLPVKIVNYSKKEKILKRKKLLSNRVKFKLNLNDQNLINLFYKVKKILKKRWMRKFKMQILAV